MKALPIRCKLLAIPLALVAVVGSLPAGEAPAPRKAPQASAALDQAVRGVVTICTPESGAKKPGSVAFFQEETLGSNILGSGIILDSDGLILTANHAIEGVDALTVILHNLGEYEAKVVATQPGLDIALLRIQAAGLVPIPWRLDASPAVGETVFAIGTPGIFATNPLPSTSQGIISALNRSIDVTGDPEQPFSADLIETDAQLLPGESGGALVDGQGRLVGMCLAVYHPGGALRGRAFALAADSWLRAGIDSLTRTGHFPIGHLGMRLGTLSFNDARRLGVQPGRGVRLVNVTAEGAAGEAGLLPGDIITRIDGEQVRLVPQARRIEMRLVPGSKAKLTVLREGSPQPRDFEVTVGGSEDGAGSRPAEFLWRQMSLRDLDETLRKQYASPLRNGVIVVDVVQNGSSWKAGLRKGDVILEINNTAVRTLAGFRDAVKVIPGKNVVRVRTTEGIGHIQGETGQ